MLLLPSHDPLTITTVIFQRFKQSVTHLFTTSKILPLNKSTLYPIAYNGLNDLLSHPEHVKYCLVWACSQIDSTVKTAFSSFLIIINMIETFKLNLIISEVKQVDHLGFFSTCIFHLHFLLIISTMHNDFQRLLYKFM